LGAMCIGQLWGPRDGDRPISYWIAEDFVPVTVYSSHPSCA
jgi:hypothetical protein